MQSRVIQTLKNQHCASSSSSSSIFVDDVDSSVGEIYNCPGASILTVALQKFET